MTMAFTGFLRISLSRGQDYITVEKEEQHVASYLQIQSVRYGSIMRYEIEIDPSLAGQRMLKLMLQPLVENAIYHGVKRKRGRGLIRVTGWRQGNEMCFAVEDDGLGMTPEQLGRSARWDCAARRSMTRIPKADMDCAMWKNGCGCIMGRDWRLKACTAKARGSVFVCPAGNRRRKITDDADFYCRR